MRSSILKRLYRHSDSKWMNIYKWVNCHNRLSCSHIFMTAAATIKSREILLRSSSWKIIPQKDQKIKSQKLKKFLETFFSFKEVFLLLTETLIKIDSCWFKKLKDYFKEESLSRIDFRLKKAFSSKGSNFRHICGSHFCHKTM